MQATADSSRERENDAVGRIGTDDEDFLLLFLLFSRCIQRLDSREFCFCAISCLYEFVCNAFKELNKRIQYDIFSTFVQ